MKKKIVVTGVNGFVGQHLTHILHSHGHDVIGLGLEKKPQARLEGKLFSYVSCDLTDQSAVDSMESDLLNTDALINLAGIATTKNTPEITAAVLRINVEAHRTLYTLFSRIKSRARFIAISTGLAYDQDQSMPLNENSKLLADVETTNAYVRSKLRVEALAAEYKAKGLDVIVARPFNHIGPYQDLGFFVPDRAAQIKEAMRESKHSELGTMLDFWRDFTDVRDVANAYTMLATAPKEKLTSNVYNIASGTPVFGRDLYKLLANELGYSNYSISTESPMEGTAQITGDSTLLRHDISWKPAIPLEQTIHDFVIAL